MASVSNAIAPMILKKFERFVSYFPFVCRFPVFREEETTTVIFRP